MLDSLSYVLKSSCRGIKVIRVKHFGTIKIYLISKLTLNLVFSFSALLFLLFFIKKMNIAFGANPSKNSINKS
jgi:hypothetical protein